ncbi:MAG: hypothetical protein PHF79_03645, partial [Candidatus Pacebacteria bacterium]|nr:hypothetical protein [Candidatus Paceibacterota bacterium]
GVFNPGVIKVDHEVIMLYRAVGERESYTSHIGLAKSKDGISFERLSKEPVFGPKQEFDKWATEDPRITQIEEDFYVTYVAVPERIMDHNQGIARDLPLETATALLKTKDFLTYENLGIISSPHSDNKDIVLFPKKIGGRYAMLHRPNRWGKEWFESLYSKKVEVPLPFPFEQLPTLPSIWIAWSDDLIHWSDNEMLLSPSHDLDAKVGPGLPPIETSDGWLMIYHHVEKSKIPGNFIYSIRVALLDLKDPTHILGKLSYDILSPERPYESENGTHIIFPTGGYISGDTLFVYYGASDKYVCLATGSVQKLLEALKLEGISGHTRHETA